MIVWEIISQVRVFGFQPEDVSILLEQLQRCGFIAERRSTPNNYMFIRYYDMLQAQKALALNGTCINGNYIGVAQCSWEEVGDAYEGNLNKARTSPMDTRYYSNSFNYDTQILCCEGE